MASSQKSRRSEARACLTPRGIGMEAAGIIKEDGSLYLANVSNMPFARPDVSSLPANLVFAEENKYPVRGNF